MKNQLPDKQLRAAISSTTNTKSHFDTSLMGLKSCLDAVFLDPGSKPSFRTFCEWKARRYFPVVKVGRRVFASPDKVRTALEKRFTIEAID